MLADKDIDLNTSRGRLCIFSDADKPCATMLVFVHAKEPDGYIIEYIRPGRAIAGKIGPVPGEDLTPVEHFGLDPFYDPNDGILRLREYGDACKATYRNGGHRYWQGEFATGLHVAVQPNIERCYAE